MDDIINFYQVTDRLASSGQPNSAQFARIADAGYKAVINLAMPDSDNAITNEGEIVTSHDMSYIHIPVVWEDPRLSDLTLFCRILQSLDSYKLWVHCAMNMRVSCFLYLYLKHILHWPDNEARIAMDNIWAPEGIWAKFIDDADNYLQRPS